MHGAWMAVALGALLGAEGSGPRMLTAEEIVSRNVAARGGLEKLRAIKTLRREGRTLFPEGSLEMKTVEVVQRPASIRTDTTFQGLTAVDSYDGKESWRVEPFQGRKDPERTSADEAKLAALAADLEFPFVDAKAKGNKLEALGVEDVDGTPAYKLRVLLKSGDTMIAYFDPDSFMLIRTVVRTLRRGAEREFETDYSDYEKVDGVFVPMLEASGKKDSPESEKVKVVYDKAAANVAVTPKSFSFPEGK